MAQKARAEKYIREFEAELMELIGDPLHIGLVSPESSVKGLGRVFGYRAWRREGTKIPKIEFLQEDGTWGRSVSYFKDTDALFRARDRSSE